MSAKIQDYFYTDKFLLKIKLSNFKHHNNRFLLFFLYLRAHYEENHRNHIMFMGVSDGVGTAKRQSVLQNGLAATTPYV